MKHRHIFHQLAAAGWLTLAFAAAADSITVRPEAHVKGPKITLGDVAEIDGPLAEVLADVEVGYAAVPGATKRLNASLIEARIRSAGLDADNITLEGAKSVDAVTMYLEVTPDMLESSLREYVAQNMPWDAVDATVEITPPSRTEVVPEGDLVFRWQPAPQYRYVGTGAFRGEIVVDGVVKKSVLVKAVIDPYTEVLVAVESIGRGDLIGAADVISERRPVASLGQDAVTSVEDLEHQVARASILPGQVITLRQVAPLKVIKRNDIVSVQKQVGALTVTTRAKAMADAGVGDTILCETIDSKGQFAGVVREDGAVMAQ
jgi:flagella basal body P-ring formation protein FlgA